MDRTIDNHIEEFLSKPEFYDKGRQSFSCRPQIWMSHTKNPQAHHLGWKNQNNTEGINEWLAKLDGELTMVC